MGYDPHPPKILCARCKMFKPRLTVQDAVSPDGLRRRPMCLACRSEVARQARAQDILAERQE